MRAANATAGQAHEVAHLLVGLAADKMPTPERVSEHTRAFFGGRQARAA